jgi:hypothetical protein
MEEKRKLENAERIDPEDLEQVSGGAVLSDTIRVIDNIRKVKETVKSTAAEAEKGAGTAGEALDGTARGIDQVMDRMHSFAGRK